MSIASEITRLQRAKSDLKTAIGNKGVTVPSSAKLDDYADYVDLIQTGGGGSSGSVKFIDYDGTILHSYSASEFANLTEMPANPTHTGLISQGWNWTLADAKAQMVAQPDDTLMIGQMYVTDDGKTRIYISLVDSTRLSPYLGIYPNGTVVVDWGDNTATDTLIGTSLTNIQRVQHTYASTGDYVITLTATSGSFCINGSDTNDNGSYLLTRTTEIVGSQRAYQNAIRKVELGSNALLDYCSFKYCYSLTSITIPSSVTTIGSSAFQFCYSLASITIPSDVTRIGGYAFQSCNSLTSITIPSGVTSIDTYAFQYCYSLTSITIPSGVTSIGAYAFPYCTSLTNITIPSGITSITTSVFSNCRSLTSITIPSSVTSIGNYAFQNCLSLTNITIPSGVTSIGNYAFQSCYSLTNITIPSSVTSIGTYAFQFCYSLPSITIPSNVTSIGIYAFHTCRSLTSITIPSSVTSIGNYAFYSCNSFTSITIPSSVTSIGNCAFQYCDSLASITIPSNVTSIGTQAFYGCNGIAEYHFLPTAPPTLANKNAFTGILADCKIYVPYSADHSVLEAYQTASNWSTYASYMVEESP